MDGCASWPSISRLSPSVGTGAVSTETVQQALRRKLRSDVQEAAASLPDEPNLETVVTDGHPVTELAQASSGLDLLILESRGYGPVRSVLLGSVSEAVMAQSRAPLVVVPRGQRTSRTVLES